MGLLVISGPPAAWGKLPGVVATLAAAMTFSLGPEHAAVRGGVLADRPGSNMAAAVPLEPCPRHEGEAPEVSVGRL